MDNTMLAIVFFVLSELSSLPQSTAAMECNGMEGLCDLRVNQVTFPGTHNSGSGFNGHLYHWGGGLALSSIWRNQQWNFTRQLHYGIRWFDIDTCYVDKGNGDWWEEGAWICHMGFGTNAYAGPVIKMLEQIHEWMNLPGNENEVIVIQFGRDVEVDFKPEQIYRSLMKSFEFLGWKPTAQTKQDGSLTANAEFYKTSTWPTLREAIESNQRIFLFLSEKLLKFKQPVEFRRNRWIVTAEWKIKITWPEILNFAGSCSGIVSKLVKNCRKFQNDDGFLELDVFGSSMTVSTWAMQASCDQYMQQSMDECYDVTRRKGKTVNAVLADWVDKSKPPNTVLQVAREQNLKNIAMFKVTN